MAIGSTLPPQAYTREMLTVAFNWLQVQPESVKKLATSPDALVGLYLRAQKFGQSSGEVDAPVSSQNFMSDLRHLAEGLKQFEEPKPRAENRAPQAEHRQPQADIRSQQLTQAQQNEYMQRAMANGHVPQASFESEINEAHNNHFRNQASAPITGLNPKTLCMIREVKEHLNLSSDAEAVGMMVAIAYKNLKNLLT